MTIRSWCHELGHTLGFEHTFGLENNGTDWDPTDAKIIVGPEYGSPYDLMSSAALEAVGLARVRSTPQLPPSPALQSQTGPSRARPRWGRICPAETCIGGSLTRWRRKSLNGPFLTSARLDEYGLQRHRRVRARRCLCCIHRQKFHRG